MPGQYPFAVVGHTSCGAIKGSIDNVKLGNLTGLPNETKRAIAETPRDVQPRDSENGHFVDNFAEENVRLKEMLDQKQIILVGGIYDLMSGKVTFFDLDGEADKSSCQFLIIFIKDRA